MFESVFFRKDEEENRNILGWPRLHIRFKVCFEMCDLRALCGFRKRLYLQSSYEGLGSVAWLEYVANLVTEIAQFWLHFHVRFEKDHLFKKIIDMKLLNL